MTIEERLAADMKEALRAKDSLRLNCIRMLRSRLQERLVAARTAEERNPVLTDEQVLEVIGTYAKQRRDSIEAYRRGGRDELADHEQAELAIVSSYLPEQLTPEALGELVREAIAETGASSPKDMGAVMKALMPRVQGRADGKQLSALVRQLLSGD